VSTLALVLIVVAVLILALIVGGYVASGRRRRADDQASAAELAQANEHLALAHAQDKGWERSGLEQAAREAFARRSPAEVRALQLVQVVDKPGTEEDQAVFRVETDHGAEYVHLHRRGDMWAGEDQLKA
jgi:type II secretory pathway pseudopilin PulG